MNRARTEYALALLLDLAGAAVALLVSTRVWQTVRTPRPRPLADDVLDLTGRTVDAAPTAFAVVALAGVVAVLATTGIVRRAVGAVLLLAGVGLLLRSAGAASAVGAQRARELVGQKHSGVGVDAATVPHVTVHGVWSALSVACGVLVAVGGLLVLLRGHRWAGLSSRYGTASSGGAAAGPADDDLDDATRRARADTALWNALDRGDDPTREDDPPRAPSDGPGAAR